ncbi:DUF7504 family protein [Halomarina oriensis]|uniref:Uncharacterized protein n=1 Tax=Halomarina oriensis TaxID=671145 RepID=A0A6B0GM39_9EURY|nr:hypothetical protein [Halomarina oriensis]MWG34549.1 hypothetical protein [Halomarina oriensis]
MTNRSPSDSGERPRGPRRFQDLLAEHKRQGCRILVTGAVDRSVVALQNRLLLGPEAAGRERTLAVVDVGDTRVAEHVPEAAAADGGTRLVRYRSVRDGSTAASSGSASTNVAVSGETDAVFERERTPLVDLRAALVDVVAAHRERADGVRPAALRVGVVTLRPLLDEHPRPAVRRFVRIVGDEVARSRGYAHFLLPIPSSDPLVDALLPTVDIHIRLRDRPESEPEQSWHLLDHGETSGWLPLDR